MRKIGLIMGLFLLFSQLKAQLNIGGNPYAWSHRIEAPKQWISPMLNKQQIEEEDLKDEQNGMPPRFGYDHSVAFNLTNSGTWSEAENGAKIWQLEIGCSGALSINFTFSQFHLAPRSVLYIYNTQHTHKIGGFTAENNKGSFEKPDKFATGLVYGDKVILELYVPKEEINKNILQINRVIHGYRYIQIPKAVQDFGGSGTCEVNVNCSEGATWQNEKRGVAMILVNGNRYCTGSLVNNTAQDAKLYFLTANHCLGGWGNPTPKDAVSNPNANDWSFWWNYESSTCANPSAEPSHQVTNGATVRANDSPSDFALLELSESPITAGANPYFNGWNRTTTPTAGGVGIHHPAGDIKKISAFTATPLLQGYNGATGNNHWRIDWVTTTNGYGVTEGGSSGSPVFNAEKQILGSLHGGPSSCTSTSKWDYYGAMCYSWDNSATNTRRLRPWLDPIGTNPISLNGTYPCPSDVTITGTYSTALTQSDTWIKSSGQTTILNTASVKLDANPTNGFVELKPSAISDFFLAAPSFSSVFIAQALDGCGVGVPMRLMSMEDKTEDKVIPTSNTLTLYPNPTTGLITVQGVEDVKSVSIFDMMGKQLLQTNTNGDAPLELNLTEYPAGVYFLKTDNGQVQKIVKQ